MIFVDTNILLDFYRVRTGGVGLELLSLIEQHKDILITGSQIEMEYKKNRQRVVLESLAAQKTPDWSGLTSPAFLAAAKPAEIIAKSKKTISTQQGRLKTYRIFKRPFSSKVKVLLNLRGVNYACPGSRIGDVPGYLSV